jgi:hypothetical protein
LSELQQRGYAMNEYDGYQTGFPAGNIERWAYTITSYLPQAWTTLQKTIDPIIYAALVELLGSNTRFDKQAGNLTPILDQQRNFAGLSVQLQYNVPDFAGFAGDPQAVQHDQQYILKKCQAIPNVQWQDSSVTIDTEHGAVTVAFVLPLV